MQVTFWSPKSIAQRWGSTADSVIKLIRTGKLHGLNLGQGAQKPRYKVTPEALAEYERSREVQPPARRGRRPKVMEPSYRKFFEE